MELPRAHGIKHKLIQSIIQTAYQRYLLDAAIGTKTYIHDDSLICLGQKRAVPDLRRRGDGWISRIHILRIASLSAKAWVDFFDRTLRCRVCLSRLCRLLRCWRAFYGFGKRMARYTRRLRLVLFRERRVLICQNRSQSAAARGDKGHLL